VSGYGAPLLSGWNSPDAPAYGGHSVYLFSTLDDPTEECLRTPSQILPPNSKSEKTGDARPGDPITGGAPSSDGRAPSDHEDIQMDGSGDQEEGEEDEDEEGDGDPETKYSEVPVILPRRSFKGVSNLRTIKDGTVFALVEGPDC